MPVPQHPPRRPAFPGGAAWLLVVAQVGFDLFAGLSALFASSVSAHDVTAQLLLAVLLLTYVVLLVVSVRLAGRDRRSGRRSPANWAMTGLLASAGVTFAFFVVLAILGYDASGTAAPGVPGGRGAPRVEILAR